MTFSDARDALVIVLLVTFVSFCSEPSHTRLVLPFLSLAFHSVVSYVFVYRKDHYKRMCERVIELNKKLAKEDAKVVTVDKRKAHEKGIERIEDDLKTTSQRMDAERFVTNFFSAAAFFFLYRFVAAWWTGLVVARLPFIPFRAIEGLSRRGLSPDQDHQACAFGLIYTLCTIGVKSNIPRLLGFIPPKSAFDAARMAARQQRKENRD